jgi:hypothetical protein
MPLDWGSTRVNTICAATAASTAAPPAWSIASPAALASGCALAMANFRPFQPGCVLTPEGPSGCRMSAAKASITGVVGGALLQPLTSTAVMRAKQGNLMATRRKNTLTLSHPGRVVVNRKGSGVNTPGFIDRCQSVPCLSNISARL